MGARENPTTLATFTALFFEVVSPDGLEFHREAGQ